LRGLPLAAEAMSWCAAHVRSLYTTAFVH